MVEQCLKPYAPHAFLKSKLEGSVCEAVKLRTMGTSLLSSLLSALLLVQMSATLGMPLRKDMCTINSHLRDYHDYRTSL